MREHFIRELNSLFSLLLAQGKQVEDAVMHAVEAVDRGDLPAACKVEDNDSVIDHEEIRIEEECLKVLALYQPVASDLRMVIAVLKMNTILERIGDFAVHIARRAPDMNPNASDFSATSSLALEMLRSALQAMKAGDVSQARSVISRDSRLDTACHVLRQQARSILETRTLPIPHTLAVLGIARDLERIGDLATDISRHLVYMLTGEILLHNGE